MFDLYQEIEGYSSKQNIDNFEYWAISLSVYSYLTA